MIQRSDQRKTLAHHGSNGIDEASMSSFVSLASGFAVVDLIVALEESRLMMYPGSTPSNPLDLLTSPRHDDNETKTTRITIGTRRNRIENMVLFVAFNTVDRERSNGM